MDENTMPTPPMPPPPPAPQPAAPSASTPPSYAAVPAAPAKSKKGLWIVFGIIAVLLIGSIAAVALGALDLFKTADPAETIEKLNAASLAGDAIEFDKYFDRQAVAEAAYEEFVVAWVDSAEAQEALAETGETDPQALLDMVSPRNEFVADVASGFEVSNIAGLQLFPNYSVTSTDISGDSAEVTVSYTDQGEEFEITLGMEQREIDGEKAWVIVEIKDYFASAGL